MNGLFWDCGSDFSGKVMVAKIETQTDESPRRG